VEKSTQEAGERRVRTIPATCRVWDC
jgi:hypothetical protein